MTEHPLMAGNRTAWCPALNDARTFRGSGEPLSFAQRRPWCQILQPRPELLCRGAAALCVQPGGAQAACVGGRRDCTLRQSLFRSVHLF